MEEKYRIYITGEGTRDELEAALKILAADIAVLDDITGNYENSILYTEVRNIPTHNMSWDEE